MHAPIFPVALILNGLLAGTFIGSAMMEHAARTLPSSAWIAYKQAKEVTFGAVMPAFLMATIVASAALAISGTTRLAFGIVALLLVAVLAVTVAVHLPINKLIQAGGPGVVPTQWNELRTRWRVWNWARCGLAVAAFLVAALA